MKIKFGSFEFEIDLFESLPAIGLMVLGLITIADVLGGK